MTLHDFNNLSDEVQQAYVFQRGTYIAQRWDDVHQAVMLCVEFLFAFEAGGEDNRLPGYALFVKLPDWLLEAVLSKS